MGEGQYQTIYLNPNLYKLMQPIQVKQKSHPEGWLKSVNSWPPD